ncbi:putative folylpolyglutamate synthase/dihydrofolate synthase [Waddlia chondrophila 2032/99]|uniref:Putative folylpolyglutamate synthase/dihydrofolate synthase n=2 Tax=Waddlia chondrophila TaxID=71667 RepID=D6YVJ7_WADCW|nr:Mur ligase family protein [Waddlia chondrophila]ADI38158.1 putative folylpolyglutamate synthase/dihydrofolate synthase [Waddlia chondrophila WSU 86-1044]CCB91149.1 putative folylpolyglutamate synthase/dihydrofolate synthase [Waddlia chondrophila 2032/99]
MSYEQLINQLFTVNTHQRMKLGLEQMRALATSVGNPDRQFRSVHIAGTNGKGSTAEKIAKGLESKFSKVGLFTSPHISTFRERIKINGKMISEDDVERILSQIIDLPGTFFELTTLLAFLYFAENNVEYAVIETGLGGRLDATNIIHPDLSVITSISLEHTEFLGSTLEEIAAEKAGIIKPGVPVILGPSALHISTPQAVQIKGKFSSVEEENRAIAKKALEQLSISPYLIMKALEARPCCRMEKQGNVILDVAHNPAALERYFCEDKRRPLNVVCTLSKNKDLKRCLEIIANHAQCISLVTAPNGRSSTPEDLYAILVEIGFPSRNISIDSSISHAVTKASQKGNTAVIGTFFIMNEARKALGMMDETDSFDLNERSC